MSELIEDNKFHQAFEELKKGSIELLHDGNPITTDGILGKGGSKTVYDANIGEKRMALALPNVVDNSSEAGRKWNSVLEEPRKTADLRSLGLLANPVCEQLEVTINSMPLRVVQMMRYQDLPFEVRDSKNRKSSIFRKNIIPESGFDDENIGQIFDGITKDIEILISNGVRVSRDSVNIALEDNQVRLYFNDLGSAEIKPFEDKEIPEVCKIYVNYSISALIESLSDAEWESNKQTFENIAYSKSGIKEKLVSQILDDIQSGI